MTSIFTRTVIGTALACASISTAVAQDTTPEETGVSTWDLFHGAPKFKDANGNTLKVRGRILWDIATLEEEVNGTTTSIDDNEFRAARIGFEGQYDDVKFKAEVDFAGSETEVKDLFVTYKGLPFDVTIGQQKVPNSMEEEASSRHIDFMERFQFTDALGFDRRVGIAIGDGGDNYSWRAGVFRNSINGMQDNQDENTVFGVRGTYALVAEKGNVLHIGGSYRYTDKDNSGQPKRSSRWGSHQAKQKIKPKVGADANLFGVEGVIIKGPFHAYAEYATEEGDLGSADGYGIATGFFLTGESRAYKAKAGVIDRTKPLTPVSKGGFGALSMNARYDVIDGKDAGSDKSTAMTAGLTWTPETHLNIKAEYTIADADTYDADGFQMRFQWDW